ncbi:hypothetical protein C3E94_27715, partial [Klebsiella pneumoniae]
MKIGYARVSTKDQTVDLQLDALKQAGCERIYQEVATPQGRKNRSLRCLAGGQFWQCSRLLIFRAVAF